MPVPYAAITDVLRLFDPSLTVADVQSDDYIGNQDVAQLRARLDSVSDDWDRLSGTPMRLRRAGTPGAPRTWDYYDADEYGRYPLVVDLDHRDIVPLDSSAGDRLEIRTGQDSWTDVTDQEGDEWILDHETGELKLYRLLVNRVWWEAPDERFVRLTHRYGALGGSRDRGGQTTLTSQAGAGDTTLEVANAARLPADGGIVRLGDASPAEYARISTTDATTSPNTITVSRGERATSATSHASGTVVHYCPEGVRDAVAQQTAAELVRYDTFIQRVDGDAEGVSPEAKLDRWDAAWDQALASASAVRTL